MECDLASQKERDHRYKDVIEVQPYPLLTSHTNWFVQDPYQLERPTFSFPQRHWKAILVLITVTKCSEQGNRSIYVMSVTV